MRVMLLIKGVPQPGAAPLGEFLGAMGRDNNELKAAGVLVDLAGLLPSAMGRRVRRSGGPARSSTGRSPSPGVVLDRPGGSTAPRSRPRSVRCETGAF
jgi:hypothetical protein